MITGFTLAVAGGLLLLSWLQHRSIPALAMWGLAFVLAAIATGLIAARGHIPDLWSIIFANTLLSAGYGTLWSGMRNFEGRSPQIGVALLGTLTWLLACTFPAFYANPLARAELMAVMGVTYTLLTVRELWRGRRELLISRWPIILVLIAHAAAIPARIPLVGALVSGQPPATALLTFVLLESLVISMCGAYLFGNLASERLIHWHRKESLVDPLTGVPNRRAFMAHGTRLMHRLAIDERPVALLLLDLDRFKDVNDNFGHSAGDRILVEFCRIATAQLRPTDFFARLGGEEFACLLPNTAHQHAITISERVRAAFAATPHVVGGESITASVSIGVAVSGASVGDLTSLMLLADRALYAAKSGGRNRVAADEPRAPRLTTVAHSA
jgi:diguanylate cyclase (GGDEF)-like protein